VSLEVRGEKIHEMKAEVREVITEGDCGGLGTVRMGEVVDDEEEEEEEEEEEKEEEEVVMVFALVDVRIE
jgi:nitroreductase